MKAIVLCDSKQGIAKFGNQPIHIPKDLQRLKALTRGDTVIMGRKTAEVLTKPLVDRRNIVITSNPHFDQLCYGFEPITIDDLESKANTEFSDAWVLGGEMVYRTLLPYCTAVYMTKVAHNFDCDKFFPSLKRTEWFMVNGSLPRIYVDHYGNSYSYDYLVYERR